jgi:hypothetical protein
MTKCLGMSCGGLAETQSLNKVHYSYQGSALIPYLFGLLMDEVTRNIQGAIPWCMLFANDVVLMDESRTGSIRSWSCGDELWRQKLLCLVGLKRST